MTGNAEAGIAALLRRPGLARVLEILNGDGEETRIVGGAVRNTLLGRPVDEVDLASTALPEIVQSRAKVAGLKTVPTGIAHGTITVLTGGEPFEVTTLREDVATDGRHAVVRFGRDFGLDAARRDFTINALSLDVHGHVHDTVGGRADIEARRVVFIGDPSARIREDYLRILRFFRFHAGYGAGPLDPAGLAAAIAAREGLATLSRERVRAELLKLVVAEGAETVLESLSFNGFFGLLLGGVADIGRFSRVVRFEREIGASPDPVRRLAAVAVMTSEDAERLRERLRLANSEHARLAAYAEALAAIKGSGGLGDRGDLRSHVARFGVEAVADVVAATAGEPATVIAADARRLLDQFVRGEAAPPVFPLTGADLLAAGIAPGPEIGRRLQRARSVWLAQGCPAGAATRDALEAVALGE